MKRFESPIELNGNNYSKILPLDIAAFSFAEVGAMGEHAGVYIITNDSNVYHLNYCDGTWHDEEQLFELIPVLKDTTFFIFSGGETSELWYVEGLGCGNYLVLLKALRDSFESMKEKYATLLKERILFNLWDDFVLEILKS